MRNNQAPMTPTIQQTNLIYEYKCVQDDCDHLPEASYVGLTTTTLSRRLTMHLSSGGPKNHNLSAHQGSPISRESLVENTKILRRESDFRRLQIYEALIIQQRRPKINQQVTGSCRTLKLYNNQNTIGSQHHRRRSNATNQNNPANNSPQQNPISIQRPPPRIPTSSTSTANPPINPANTTDQELATHRAVADDVMSAIMLT